LLPCPHSAAAVAVDLSSVAATANDHLTAAASTQEQTTEYNPGLPRVAAAT
jgi:hypothetical protein